MERSEQGQSNLRSAPPHPSLRAGPSPPGERTARSITAADSKLAPPPDNSFDRRADFAKAHRARASVARGFGEAPQSGYVGKSPVNSPVKSPVPPGELDPDLARALGIEEQDEKTADDIRNVITPDMGPAHLRLARSKSADAGTVAGFASQQSLDQLLREGRAEFRNEDGDTRIWTPHRPPRPEKSEGGRSLVIKSDFDPKGDQPQAIAELVEGVRRNDRTQVLLGVTGSGKTFTMAKVIEETQRPALILAPNKTLAAQLYGEFRSFFPDNAVEYFVSYYDYYQPEAYIPRTDTYIEKDFFDQRADRPHASCGDARAVGTRRRRHRRLGVVHLRYRLGRDLFGDDVLRSSAASGSTSARCSPIWSRCNTSARAAISIAARSACAATLSRFFPPTMKTAPGACRCSATKWN